MSKAADNIRVALDNYLSRMHQIKKAPSALYVTSQQFETLRAETGKRKGEFKPRYKGLEVKKYG